MRKLAQVEHAAAPTCKCIEWTKFSPPPPTSTGYSWPQINTSYMYTTAYIVYRLNDYNFASLTLLLLLLLLLLLSVAMASQINGEDAFIGLATHQRSGNFGNCSCIATRTIAGLPGWLLLPATSERETPSLPACLLARRRRQSIAVGTANVQCKTSSRPNQVHKG